MNKQSLEKLLVEIGSSQLLSHEEELALLKAVQEKGTDCNEMKLFEKANMRFVVSVHIAGNRKEKIIENKNQS